MKVGTEDKKKLIIAGVLGFFAIFSMYFIYSQLFGGATPAPNPAAVVTTQPAVKTSTAPGTGKAVVAPPGFAVGSGANAKKIGSTSAQLDPTLHMEAMHVTESLVYTGTGRNIFAAQAEAPAAPKLVKANFPVRPTVQQPVPVQNLGPPPPPPINLKFFGTATRPGGDRRAFLLNGDDVFLASVGDIVQRRYRVIAINSGSILVEDIPNTNRQTLPLITTPATP